MLRARAARKAVLHNQHACRAKCRQAKQWMWPAARTWHALTGWPQPSADQAVQRAYVPTGLNALLQATGGATFAMLGALYGLWRPDGCTWLNRGTGEALGALVATPLEGLTDFVAIGGATLLSLSAMALDTSGAAVGTLAGLLSAPYVAYAAWVR